ncbi:MAG: hypothetical protein V1836_02690 [Candidatus Aenigmatarchaeota archaeon]
MSYERLNQDQAQLLARGTLVRLYGDGEYDVFRVDLTPRRGALLNTVRLHSYRKGIVNVTHDMIAFDDDLARRLKENALTDFSKFSAYFVRDGLTQHEQTAIRDYLERLYLRTGHLWKPSGCTNIPDYTEEANDELSLSSAKGVLTKMVPKRYSHSHFFWASKKVDELFIIDPTGVPNDSKNMDENISPFFGLLKNSTGFHRTVYEKMKNMDDWGTRDLPPGFHP